MLQVKVADDGDLHRRSGIFTGLDEPLGGHQAVIMAVRLGLVLPEADLPLPDLHVPRVLVAAEPGLRLTHSNPPGRE
jgi:hypothetical protein